MIEKCLMLVRVLPGGKGKAGVKMVRKFEELLLEKTYGMKDFPFGGENSVLARPLTKINTSPHGTVLQGTPIT